MKRMRANAGTASRSRGDDEIRIRIERFGPDARSVAKASRAVARNPAVRKLLDGTRQRLLSVTLLEPPERGKRREAAEPEALRATFYDYTNNRTVLVDAALADPGRVEITDSAAQPLPSSEEFEDAVRIVQESGETGLPVTRAELRPYRPMPPLVEMELPDGRSARVVAVGLMPERTGARHEIVGVNLLDESVVRFEGGAPPLAQAHNPICGLPNAGQATVSAGAGQVWLTVQQGGTVLWRLLAVRPAASSGTNGSGVELRHVDYRGRRVLSRAHVPILNVKYDNDACGPFRDWQNEEGALQAVGQNVAPGFRRCSSPATTILDTGSDNGNFVGVAVYRQGQELVLVSEMEAGWYRYVSEWRLHANGTIRPRFGFSAVRSSCVCTRHHHHAYWRLDFDVQTGPNNVVREFNDPPVVPGSNWHQLLYEIRRMRNPARKRRWRVEHAPSGRAYEVVPGPDDGVATASPDWPFPRGDVWVLRYRPNQIDDGSVATGPPYAAQLDSFKNSESIDRKDVVVWYGGHFTHDPTEEAEDAHGHTVGPTLRPVSW